MKKLLVYVALGLALSLALCGCGSVTDDGNVTASPWPDVTDPVLPTPSPMVSATPIPGNGVGGSDGAGYDLPTASAAPDMGMSSPKPTDSLR